VEPNLNSIIPEHIRLITFQENTIRILLKGEREVVFEFKSREELAAALEAWARKPSVAGHLSESVKSSITASKPA
jgi:hypothetical protein